MLESFIAKNIFYNPCSDILEQNIKSIFERTAGDNKPDEYCALTITQIL